MKVKILGTEYEIIRDASEKDYPQLKNADGFTDFSIKRIVIADFEKDENSIDDLEQYKMKVLRHELIHAYIYESGLAENCDWARNEELIDWIAIQFGKMVNTFIEVGALGVIISIDYMLKSFFPEEKTKVSTKDNTEAVNDISKAMKETPIEVNEKKFATGGVIRGDG